MNKQLVKRISSIAIIVFGIAFGATWNRLEFCLGDRIFSALGLPAWSNGSDETHYPAVVGLILILIGIVVLNTTLSKRARMWAWVMTVLIYAILTLCFTLL